ncbi:hypothetical protein MBLNU230_g3147t1 [Neophaeotheca triangularis]
MKRKGSPSLDEESDNSKRHAADVETAEGAPTATESSVAPTTTNEELSTSTKPKSASESMRERFAAAQARAKQSKKDNRRETQNESKRAATDPSQLTAITRKRDVAQHKLLKADTEAAGEDFERKRAWDWTVDESEKWDERMAEKEAARQGVAFSDYTQEANKVYERQLKQMNRAGGDKERLERYEQDKREMMEKRIKSGEVELVEAEDGELIAVDRNGSFYSTAESTGFVNNKPDKAAVDRLVGDIKKAEEIRLKKRKARGIEDEGDGDVSFINEKNKQFNQKLARFYDKYTADIKKSFERGTAI